MRRLRATFEGEVRKCAGTKSSLGVARLSSEVVTEQLFITSSSLITSLLLFAERVRAIPNGFQYR